MNIFKRTFPYGVFGSNLHVDKRMAGVSRNILSVRPFCGEEGTAARNTIKSADLGFGRSVDSMT